MKAVKGAVRKVRGAVKNAADKAVTDASNEATKEATKEAVVLIRHLLPGAIHETLLPETVAGKPVDGIAGGAGRLVGRKAARFVGEKLAHLAVQAIKTAEDAIEVALPVSGVVAYEPPIALYTETYECNRPTPGEFRSKLQDALLAANGKNQCDELVDLYAQVVDRGKFEDELCRGDKDEAAKLKHLLEVIPQVVGLSTGGAVEVAEMLRDKPSMGKMREAMYDAAIRAGRPVVGWLGTYEKSADDLRNLEVIVRELRPEPKAALTQNERELVEMVRARTWGAIVDASGGVDMTRFGSKYGLVPLPVLRENTVRLIPDPVPQASAVVNFGLGEWGLLESLRDLVKFAADRLKLSDPEKAAKLAAYAERGQSLGQELLGLYVVRQHVGFEEPGTGYALAVATGTLRALPRTSVYAHATRCLLVYIRALLLPKADDNEKIDRVVADLPMPKRDASRATEPYELPDVPLACRGGPVGHDARTRRLVRDVCAKSGELAEKGKAMEWLVTTFGEGAIPDVTAAMVDAMFEMHDALGALAIISKISKKNEVGGAVAANVAKTLADMQKVELTVGQRRRLEVMQTRVKEAMGEGNVDLAGAEVYYAHIAAQAKDGKPHGLAAHEFGVAHTAFYVGPTVVYRAPLVEEAPAHGSWMGSLLALMVPNSLQTVVDAASDAASGRKVQYRGGEPPGVGYAIYALLPVLDHASVMGYGAVKQRTLMAVKCLLGAK